MFSLDTVFQINDNGVYFYYQEDSNKLSREIINCKYDLINQVPNKNQKKQSHPFTGIV